MGEVVGEVVGLWGVGISTLFFLKIRLYFVGNLSNFDKLLIINFVLACTYSNGQHDPLPPTAEAAQLVQQRTHTIITKHRHMIHNLAHIHTAS